MPKDFFLFNEYSVKFILKIIFICLTLQVHTQALDLDEKYPSYTYVFNEFDIDHTYIFNDEFIHFSLKNEKFLERFYKRSLKRGKEILPTMKGLLADEGMSDVFIYLSMIESGFSSDAVSPKKAVGLWQFMPATAKHYNLTVCADYDERCDTVASTSAASNYLNKLYRQFGKWYLAAMAYNCGEGCVEKAIRRAGTDALSVLTDETFKYVPKETREYIKKIVLIAMIGENNILGYSSFVDYGVKSDFIDVEVKGGTDLKDIATLIKMEYGALQKLNLKIKNGLIPKNKRRYSIRIPLEKVFAFYLRYEFETDNLPIKPHLVSHYVKMGETLESIASKYNTSSWEIIQANHLENEYLTLDQFLVIPVSKIIFETTLVGTSK